MTAGGGKTGKPEAQTSPNQPKPTSMWKIYPTLLGYLVLVYAAAAVGTSGFYAVIFLLSLLTPGHKAIVEEWKVFLKMHAYAHWIPAISILVFASVWNVVEWYVAPTVGPRVTPVWRGVKESIKGSFRRRQGYRQV